MNKNLLICRGAPPPRQRASLLIIESQKLNSKSRRKVLPSVLGGTRCNFSSPASPTPRCAQRGGRERRTFPLLSRDRGRRADDLLQEYWKIATKIANPGKKIKHHQETPSNFSKELREEEKRKELGSHSPKMLGSCCVTGWGFFRDENQQKVWVKPDWHF